MSNNTTPGKKLGHICFKVALRDIKPEDTVPNLTAVAIDANGKLIEQFDANAEGEFRISTKAFNAAAKVLIGAKDSEPGKDVKFITFHKYQIAKAVDAERALDLPRRTWLELLWIRYCIDGTTLHCQWRPFLTEIYNTRILRAAEKGFLYIADQASHKRLVAVDSVLEPVYPGWKLCRPLCDGVVEVYRRTCCCHPIVIYDPRIPDIIRKLEDLVLREPPIGPPDPGPLRFEDVSFLAGGGVNEHAINASVDLKAIRALEPAQQVAYIQARPHLFCWCESHKLVASGFIQPDGSFNICWKEPLRLLWIRCHEEYAFVIKQLVDDETLTIYDGIAAGQWFHLNDEIKLTSYNPDALICDEPDDPPPGTTGTSVMLEAIRSTDSLQLNSPLPSGWDRVPAPSGTQGLAFPAPLAVTPVQWNNVGWGKTLPLRYLFFSDLEPIATFYRISVTGCDAMGEPTGTRKYLDQPLSWVWYRRRTDLTIKRETFSLGSVGDKLYQIPYRSLFQGLLAVGEIGEWAFRQFHGFVNTTGFANRRHLVTIELFDAGQNQIKPATAPATDPGTAAGFSFQAWNQADLSATVPVHFGALTHLFWWDNRSTKARILSVNKNGAPFVEECLFLDGPRNTNVSIDYRAKHDEPLFLYWHDLRWKRGLFTPWQTWVDLTAASVDPGTSPNRTYDQLLDTKDQCAFTIEVRTRAKITHGAGRIIDYDDRDDGAIAIISPAP
ncbi:MAG: hypothetical protein ACC700_16685 [Anaerolineales bacterium]